MSYMHGSLGRRWALGLSAAALLVLVGCPSPTPPAGNGGGTTGTGTGNGGNQPAPPPVFRLAWSEYPSWSAFDVASTNHIIDGAAGQLGTVEKKWNVDIVLKEIDYDTCIQAYASGQVDAVCITNMDILGPSAGVDSVAILPTSTSDGADALIVTGIEDVDALKKHKVYGLDKSVSEYCFARNLEILGKSDADYQFSGMDPGAAATAMQTGQDGYQAIMVWNPFVLQTLKTVPNAKVLFDSSQIPGEIIDMVVASKKSLQQPGGKEFACAVIEAYYELNKLLDDPQHHDEVLVEIGRKFSNLSLEEMTTVVEQTKFFKTPQAGLEALTKTLPEKMDKVVDFCVAKKIVETAPKIVFGKQDGAAQLTFDPSYIEEVERQAK